MKAMVLRAFGLPDASGPLVLSDVPRPEVGAGEILIRVSCCGVCHTDLHTVVGELPDVILPRIPGHEVVGVVDRAGKGARRFKEGQRVGAAWLHSACGVCRFCLRGEENLCERAQFNGFHVDGGYAEFMKVPEAFAYALPEVFSDEEAAPLLCAGIIGYRALRLSEVKPGGTLGLFGFGASAHIAIQVARKWDCHVFVFTRSEEHRALARELGADWVGEAKDDPPAKVDGAVIFAPVGALYLDALRVLDRGGTAASAGIHMSPIPELDYDRLLYHERSMRSVANATRRDGEELLGIAAQIPVRTTTQSFPLEKANEALALLKAGRVNGAAVLRVKP
jgi:alcohol dehydrogenase, propanol-preferring